MKKIYGKLATLVCFLLVTANVYAVGGYHTEYRIWQKRTTDANFPALRADISAGTDATDVDIKAEDVGLFVCRSLKEQSRLDLIAPKYRSPKACSRKFLEFAFVSKPGDKIPGRISWEYIKDKGQGKVGWRVPVDNRLSKGLQAAEHKIVTLQSQVGDNKGLRIKVEEALKALAEGEKAFREGMLTQPKIDAINGQVDTLSGLVRQLVKTTDINTKQIADNVNEISNTRLVFGAVAFLLLLLGLYWRVSGHIKTKAHEEILNGDGTDDRPGLVNKFDKHDAKILEIEKDVKNLQDGQKRLMDHLLWNVTFSEKDLEVTLKSLFDEKTHKESTSLVGIFNNTRNDWLLDFEKGSGGMVIIHGIRDEDGSNDFLPPCANDLAVIAEKIREAGRDGRLIGKKSPSVAPLVPIRSLQSVS